MTRADTSCTRASPEFVCVVRYGLASRTRRPTIFVVAVVKRSVSIDSEVARAAEDAPAGEGVSFSAWLSEAAERRLRVREGLRGVAEWEQVDGAFTPDELAAGELLLERFLSGGVW